MHSISSLESYSTPCITDGPDPMTADLPAPLSEPCSRTQCSVQGAQQQRAYCSSEGERCADAAYCWCLQAGGMAMSRVLTPTHPIFTFLRPSPSRIHQVLPAERGLFPSLSRQLLLEHVAAALNLGV